ncbi:MAG TPA: hypothetical protein VNB22_20595 [Pyrinomonadaceae bacterium]|jgi:hypothetical protein|nr:hypothetical protein [Pyrinomonadaceae bacterium]
MKTSTENSSENPLERAAEKEQISVYSVNFTQIVNNHNAEKEIIVKPLTAESPEERKKRLRLSGTILKRRNTIGIAAILVVGILHFAFQLSVIQTEKKQVAENPVSIEQVREQPAETKPGEFQATKTDVILPEKTAPQIKQRQPEIAPLKPQLKKKEAIDSRAERLRRAEKILTGI